MQAGPSLSTHWAPAHQSSRSLPAVKTLVLLSALVLLAFQVQANPIQETEEETKTEQQPGEEDQDVSVSFGGPEGSALQDAVSRKLTCYCRSRSCRGRERINGNCTKGYLTYILCCR